MRRVWSESNDRRSDQAQATSNKQQLTFNYGHAHIFGQELNYLIIIMINTLNTNY